MKYCHLWVLINAVPISILWIHLIKNDKCNENAKLLVFFKTE